MKTLDAANRGGRLSHLFEKLLEHFDTSDGRLQGVPQPDDLDFVANLDDSLLDTSRGHGSATANAENILHRHQERLVEDPGRRGNVLVDGIHELDDGLLADVVVASLDSGKGRSADDLNGITLFVCHVSLGRFGQGNAGKPPCGEAHPKEKSWVPRTDTRQEVPGSPSRSARAVLRPHSRRRRVC
eukprot:scaffold48_cov311-Pinguiococcus_pyrenoidosus.AAC.47